MPRDGFATPSAGLAIVCPPLFLSFHSYYAILFDLELHTSFGQSKVFCLTRVFEPMTTKYYSHHLLITIISGYSNWSIMKGQSGVFKNNLDSLKLFSNGQSRSSYRYWCSHGQKNENDQKLWCFSLPLSLLASPSSQYVISFLIYKSTTMFILPLLARSRQSETGHFLWPLKTNSKVRKKPYSMPQWHHHFFGITRTFLLPCSLAPERGCCDHTFSPDPNSPQCALFENESLLEIERTVWSWKTRHSLSSQWL